VDYWLRALAESQHGTVSWEQARGLGFSRAGLHRRRNRGEWVDATPRVLLLHGAPASAQQDAMIAVLDAGPGAFLSHHSAAGLWSLPGFRLSDLHVTRPRDGARRVSRRAALHSCRVVHGSHVTVQDGIPVTTPARTIFDLAALVHPLRVKRALETAWSKRLLDGVRMAGVLDDLGKRGRAGTTIMRELLADRGPDYIPPDSGLESRFNDILVRDGQRPMERQVHVGGETWLGRVDFYDREARLIVQIDSARYHSALVDKQADDAQTAALKNAGFRVLRFSDFEVWYCAAEVAAKVRRARSGRTGA
jgi:very-short-patch-repair endonuclease